MWWFVAAAQAATGGQLVDRLAAVVDDEVIALSEIYDLGGDFIHQRCELPEPKCVRGAELEVLDALIKRSLVHSELRKLDLMVTGADVDQAIDRIVGEYQMADRAALRAEVEQQGMRWDTYREQVTEQMATQRFQARVLAPRVTVTEDELLDLYQRTVGPKEALEVEIRALGVSVPPGATSDQLAAMTAQVTGLVADLNADRVTWDQAITDYDGAHVSQVFGGRKWQEGQLIPALNGLAFEVPIGEAQGPVQLGSLFVVMEVVSRGVSEAAPSGAAAFEEVKPKLQEQLFGQKLEDAESEWYQIARRQASVEILLEQP